MSSSTDKTPSRDEQLRKLLEEAKEDQREHERAMEAMVMRSAEKSKRMSAALEGLLAENLEDKLVREMDQSSGERLELLDTVENLQDIYEPTERSALKPSGRDTNSPREDKPIQNRATQDVRTHFHDHGRDKIEELERKLREFEDADYHRRRQEERNQALREAEEAKSFKDRVGQVRQSFGGSLKNSMAYDKTNKVEAVNGLELLTGALKIAGGSKSVDLTTVSPTTVYNWLESCDRVRKLHPAIFDDFFPTLISPDVWTSIQAWNGARKQDQFAPGEWWPIVENMPASTFIGRGGFIDTTKLGSHPERRRIPKYERATDLNDTHGEGLRGIGWTAVMSILRMMVAPKKERDFQAQLESEADRRLPQSLKEKLLKHKGVLRLVDGEALSTASKSAAKVIKDVINYLQEGRFWAIKAHETGFVELRYSGKDGLETMIKSMFEKWGAKHSFLLHVQVHSKWPHAMIASIRDSVVKREPSEGQQKKVATLDDYWLVTEEYWTALYDLGHTTVTTLDSLGVNVDSKHLGSMGMSERLYDESELLEIKSQWKGEAREKTRIALQAC